MALLADDWTTGSGDLLVAQDGLGCGQVPAGVQAKTAQNAGTQI